MTAKPVSTLVTQTYNTRETEEDHVCLVCVSDLFWDEHWSSEQQLMSRLAKRCRVLYVDRPVSIFSFFTGTSDASVARQWSRWFRGGLRQESWNLFVLSPAPLLPFRYNGLVNRINGWVRKRSIQRALRKMNSATEVLWIYTPDAGGIVGKLGESYSLYYCADDWSASGQWWNNARDIRAREGELARNVNLVVGTSTKIVERWKQTHPNTMLVTNGGDVESFKTARNPTLPVPPDLQAIPEPRIGYVGFVDSRFDTGLYAALAESHPEWQFVIVGPLMEQHVDLSSLRKLTNVHFLGPRTRAELPSYLKGFNVCTIPYICSELAESIFPLKLFEYLAAGRPVVSTALPELLRYKEYVYIAHTREGFEKSLIESLHHALPLLPEKVLDQNSWSAKSELLWDTLERAVAACRAGNDSSGRNL